MRSVYFNGKFVPETEANISIYDSALMFGDMIFDMTRSYNKKQFRLRKHLERLYNSMKSAEISIDMSIDEMEKACLDTIKKNESFFEPHDEHRLMINVSRGPLSIYAESIGFLMKSPHNWFMTGLETNDKADVHFKDTGLETVPYQYNIRSMMTVKLVDEDNNVTGKALFCWDEDLGRKDILNKGDAELALKTFREKIKKNLY